MMATNFDAARSTCEFFLPAIGEDATLPDIDLLPVVRDPLADVSCDPGQDLYDISHRLKYDRFRNRYQVTYGSSLSLMMAANRLINEGEFDANPNKDWKKHEKQGRSLLYALVKEYKVGETGELHGGPIPAAAMRVQLDMPAPDEAPHLQQLWEAPPTELTPSTETCLEKSASSTAQPTEKRRKVSHAQHSRIVLDYIQTAEAYRGKGIAEALVRWVMEIARQKDADFLVCSIEDAATYWFQKFGLILEQEKALREHYNLFTDTYLLKRPGNRAGNTDYGYDPAALQQSDGDGDIQDDNGDGSEESEGDAEEDEDEDVQAAIAASMGQNPDDEVQAALPACMAGNSDEDLAQALAESLRSAASSPCPPQPVREVIQTEDENMDEEDRQQLELALALSRMKE